MRTVWQVSVQGVAMRPPMRIQRRRTKGWHMPPGAIYVGRPSKWGNQLRIGIDGTAQECVDKYREFIAGNIWSSPTKREIFEQLRGKDLACWCPLPKAGEPDMCHAAILLEIANP